MVNTPKKQIIGALVQVSFPQFGMNKVLAKIDTGAYTGSFHCTKIEEVQTPKGSELHFSPFDHPEITVLSDKYYVKHVKSSNGTREKRFIIETQIALDGKKYPIILSLADRSSMKWPVLIGRRFLRNNNFLVDVHRRVPVPSKGRGATK